MSPSWKCDIAGITFSQWKLNKIRFYNPKKLHRFITTKINLQACNGCSFLGPYVNTDMTNDKIFFEEFDFRELNESNHKGNLKYCVHLLTPICRQKCNKLLI